jgi:signal transduction histidine kinase
MEAMVRDLLDLARVETPGAKFKPSSLRPQEVLRELHAAFADAVAVKSLRWETNVDERCTGLVANPELLRIVMRNLVDNAIKFTEPGGRICVNIRSEPGWATVEVADDGCGIATSEQQRVFERFYQVKRDRSGPERGTGLGLSIVRHAVTAMGGRVKLTSEPGKGTSVTVEIPQPS